MMIGLLFPGILATLLSAQGAFAALFEPGFYSISPDINKPDYLGSNPNHTVSLSERRTFWHVEPHNGEWTIYHTEAGYLGRVETYGPHTLVATLQEAQKWKIEQHEHREGTWRIVSPQARDHPIFGGMAALTYYETPEYHAVDVEPLADVKRPDFIQYWRFTSILR